VLVTAHWSEATPTISNAAKHDLYYDYYGFPPETYKIKYDAPGDPFVAQEVYDALSAQGLKPKLNSKRGIVSLCIPQ
jgi:aromatic ring-opening dioxygenase catalytic subunit (LigB family)